MVTYQTLLYRIFWLIIAYLLTFFGALALIMWISVRLHLSPAYTAIAYIFLVVLPFVYERRLKRMFSQPVLLTFDDSGLHIDLADQQGKPIKQVKYVAWQGLRAYSIDFPANKYTYLYLYPRSGRVRLYIFNEQLTFEEALNRDSILRYLIRFTREYNATQNELEKIDLSPGFLNTTAGAVFLNAFGTLIVISILLHIILRPGSSVISVVVGLLTLVQLRWRKKQSWEAYQTLLSQTL
jgi:hypothetical protein